MTRGGRGTTGALHRPQRTLVVAQVSLSVLLCAAAALLARSYYNLTRVDLGLSADAVVTFHVAARWDEDRKRLGPVQQAIVSGLQNQPGIEAAGLTSFLPAGGAPWRQAVAIDGRAAGAVGECYGWSADDHDRLPAGASGAAPCRRLVPGFRQ